MKITKLVFATILVAVTAACAADVTEPQLRAPDAPAALVAPADTTPAPPVPSPGHEPTGEGAIGSGVGK